MTEREGRMTWDGHETWYRVLGDLESNASVPVVVCHGGPGAAHDYCEAIADLNRFGRGVRPVRPDRAAARASIFRRLLRASGRRSSSRTSWVS